MAQGNVAIIYPNREDGETRARRIIVSNRINPNGRNADHRCIAEAAFGEQEGWEKFYRKRFIL
jgi:hypothetical protein